MSEITSCPDCAKALERWHKRERRMAARGNFGIVPLPTTCPKHPKFAPIGQHGRAERAEALLRECEIVLSMVPTREPLTGWLKSFNEEYVAPLVKKIRTT